MASVSRRDQWPRAPGFGAWTFLESPRALAARANLPEVSVAPRPIRFGALVEAIKRDAAADAEDRYPDVVVEVAQHFLDLRRGVDVLVRHQHAVIEPVAPTKLEPGRHLPSERPQPGALARYRDPQ